MSRFRWWRWLCGGVWYHVEFRGASYPGLFPSMCNYYWHRWQREKPRAPIFDIIATEDYG